MLCLLKISKLVLIAAVKRTVVVSMILPSTLQPWNVQYNETLVYSYHLWVSEDQGSKQIFSLLSYDFSSCLAMCATVAPRHGSCQVGSFRSCLGFERQELKQRAYSVSNEMVIVSSNLAWLSPLAPDPHLWRFRDQKGKAKQRFGWWEHFVAF